MDLQAPFTEPWRGMTMSLNACTEELIRELVAAGSDTHPVEDYGWFNLVLSGPYARAHVERIVRHKVNILHCVVMPHTNDPAPIFGFDVIGLNGYLTGMFLDLTPTAKTDPWPVTPNIEGTPRALPDWANFFSRQMISVVPTEKDVWAGLRVLREHLGLLRSDAGDSRVIAAQQQFYTEQQRANPKTYRMLASIVGPEKANEFIRTVLWPDVIPGGNHGRSPT